MWLVIVAQLEEHAVFLDVFLDRDRGQVNSGNKPLFKKEQLFILLYYTVHLSCAALEEEKWVY